MKYLLLISLLATNAFGQRARDLTVQSAVDVQGITFNGGADALSFYEEGTFTPLMRGSTVAGTFGLTIDTARYVRIGKFIHIDLDITVASISGSPTGGLNITDLPVASIGEMAAPVATANVNVDATTVQMNIINVSGTGSTTIAFAQSVDNGALIILPVSAVAVGSRFFISMSYVTN